MDPVTLAVASVGTAIASLGWLGRRAARARRGVLVGDEAAVDAARDGAVVRVAGVVRALGPAGVAPLFGERCVLHDALVVIEEWSDRFRIELVQDAVACDFVLEVGARRLRVAAQSARVRFDVGRHERTGMVAPPLPAPMLALLAAKGRAHESVVPRLRRYRCVERVLPVDCHAEVVGVARWIADPDAPAIAGYRAPPLTLTVVPDARGYLAITRGAAAVRVQVTVGLPAPPPHRRQPAELLWWGRPPCLPSELRQARRPAPLPEYPSQRRLTPMPHHRGSGCYGSGTPASHAPHARKRTFSGGPPRPSVRPSHAQ